MDGLAGIHLLSIAFGSYDKTNSHKLHQIEIQGNYLNGYISSYKTSPSKVNS
jgi:hypothetical protein